jgi:hypothetical protein
MLDLSMHLEIPPRLNTNAIGEQSMRLGKRVKGQGGKGVMLRVIGHVPGEPADESVGVGRARVMQHFTH